MNFNQELDTMWEKDNRIAQLEEELAKVTARYNCVRDMTPEDFGNLSTINNDFDSQVDAMIKAQQDHIPNVGKMVQSQAQQESHDELTLRRLLCMAYSGSNAYMDDGELQDNTTLPFIDFKRDSAWELQKKLHARLVNSVVILEPPLPSAPEGGDK